jgi:hypothetical protein
VAQAPQKPQRQPQPLTSLYPAYSIAPMMVALAGTSYFFPKIKTFIIFSIFTLSL